MLKSEDNLFTTLLHKYLPYWPLFVILLLLSTVAAWAYLHFIATPLYEATATLIIKDERKGVNESRMAESIDAFISNNIVENELKVIKSRALIKQVINDLQLYAQIYEEDKLKSTLAYASSPIAIATDSPTQINEVDKVYFEFDEAVNEVIIDDKRYPINQLVFTPYGKLLFTKNKNRTKSAKLPLYFTLKSPKKVTDEILDALTIEAESKVSTVVNLKLLDPIPARGEEILNSLIVAYNEIAITERNRLARNTLAFVEDRIKLVEQELTELENKVVQFKSAKGATDLSEQGKVFLKNVGDNDRKISELNSQLAVLDKVERYVITKDNAVGIVPSTLGINDAVLTQLLQKLYDAELEYQKLRKTTAENNPILMSVSDEINKIRPSILENIRSQRVNLLATKSNLASSNNQFSSALQTIPQKERELLEISRQQAIKNDAYSFLLQKREETVLSNAPTASDSKIIDSAESSIWPVSPKALYIYIIAAFLSFGFSIGLVTAKELLNGKLLFRSEISDCTKAPIVGEVSYFKQQNNKLFKAPTEPFIIEQFRQLRVSMGLYGRSFSKKKIMVTSNIPGEGKSFVSSNLALSLASSGKKVLLIDLDLRKPSTSQLFGMLDYEGIIELLNNDIAPEKIIRETTFTNLSIIPAGINIGDHTEILLNGKLEMLFDHLDKLFDYLVIDTPPVELVSDAYLISEYCNITLLVMRHAHTPKALVQQLAENDKLSALRNVAIVFNGVKPRGFINGQYGYGYGYGLERKYGNKYYRNNTVKA